MDKIKIQYKLEKETELGLFTDYVYFTTEQWDKITPEELEKITNDRATNWVNTMVSLRDNPPVITEEELLREKEELLKQINVVEGRLEEVNVNK